MRPVPQVPRTRSKTMNVGGLGALSVLLVWVPVRQVITPLGIANLVFTIAIAIVIVAVAMKLHSSNFTATVSLRTATLLFCSFALGFVNASLVGYSGDKAIVLFSLTLLICLAASTLFQGRADLELLNDALMVVSLGVIVPGLLISGLDSSMFQRLTFYDMNPIMTGRVGALAAVTGLLAIVRTRRARTALGSSALFLGIFLMVATGTRGALVPVMAAAATLAIARHRDLRRTLRKPSRAVQGLFFGSLVLAALWGAPDLGTRRLLTEFGDSGRSDLVGQREIRPKSLLFGNGWGEYSGESPPVRLYPHNVLIEVFNEAGVLAVAGLAIVLFVAFRACMRRRGFGGLEGLVPLVMLTGFALVSFDLNGNAMLLCYAFASIAVFYREPRRSGTSEASSRELNISGPQTLAHDDE